MYSVKVMDNFGWSQKLASLTKKNHLLVFTKARERWSHISCGSFPNMPLIGLKGCISYNPTSFEAVGLPHIWKTKWNCFRRVFATWHGYPKSRFARKHNQRMGKGACQRNWIKKKSWPNKRVVQAMDERKRQASQVAFPCGSLLSAYIAWTRSDLMSVEEDNELKAKVL